MRNQLDPSIVGTVSLTAGQSNLCLPPEIIAYVWSFLTLKELVKFGRTSRSNHQLVRSALKNTIFRLIAPFTPRKGVNEFLNMMRSERAVISGSMALYPLVFCNFSGTNSSDVRWNPHDMDIYEPEIEEQKSGVLKYMVDEEGYRECTMKLRSRVCSARQASRPWQPFCRCGDICKFECCIANLQFPLYTGF
jgi:hypothetical protein